MTLTHDSVLGLHLLSGGFGWVFFDRPHSLFDWGTADIRHGDDGKLLGRVNALIGKYQPLVLVIEEFEPCAMLRPARVRDLYRLIIRKAEACEMRVKCIGLEEIRSVLKPARTRYAMAAAVAAMLSELKTYLPKKRRLWEAERLSMAVFSAAACSVAYYASSA